MTLQRKVQFWLFAFVGFMLFVYVFRGVLLPFVAAMAIAYLLDPVADRLERLGMSRTFAVATIILVSIVVLMFGLLLLLPLIAKQAASLALLLPDLADYLVTFVREGGYQNILARFGLSTEDLSASLGSILATGSDWVARLAGSLLSGGAFVLSVVSLLLVTPVVATYLLVDWDRMVAQIDKWLPRDHVRTVRRLAKEIDMSVAGFVRGQIVVSTFLGVFYAISLAAIGLDFALLIGVVSGVLSVVPYVGTIVGFAASVGVALYQFWPDWPWVVLVVGLFVLGQFIEGNILQPRVIGKRVGLHPVWLMFALFAFGSLFGFVGMLIAVPAAAAVGVLARFALNQYLQSMYFYGSNPQNAALGPDPVGQYPVGEYPGGGDPLGPDQRAEPPKAEQQKAGGPGESVAQ